MLDSLKRSAFWMTRRTGLFEQVGQSAWRRGRLLILCYHGISITDEHEWNPYLYVSAVTLARRFALIKRHRCHVLHLQEGIERLYSGTLPDRAVVLTFDDGYFDFLLRAHPLLERNGFPATVYLTTQRVEHNFPVARLFVSYALWKQRHMTLDGRDLPGLDATRYPLATAAQRQAVLARVYPAIDGMGLVAKDAAVRELAARIGLDYDAQRAKRVLTLLNPTEVSALATRGVDFQLHTHRHRTPVNPDAFAEEVTTNRERIVRMTGTAPSHFCYPSGVWRSSYLPRLRSAGIRSATTCAAGLADRSSEPLLLPRVVDGEQVSDQEFEAWLTGPAAWLPRRAGGVRRAPRAA
jgi:peptidoglycan/xylan/chitin deacetylase (PgdA/CDA1 family)